MGQCWKGRGGERIGGEEGGREGEGGTIGWVAREGECSEGGEPMAVEWGGGS